MKLWNLNLTLMNPRTCDLTQEILQERGRIIAERIDPIFFPITCENVIIIRNSLL